VEDKLTLFRNLLDASDELTVNLALALLKVIHQELSMDQTRDRLMYKRYAEQIAAMRFRMPGILQQVVNAWKARSSATHVDDRTKAPVEWFSTGHQR
jgi:hypothetical protein